MSLKKLSLLLLVAGLFVNSFAILLVVDEDGLGMDFATIGDALETAEKGDTIIITKKHTGDWHEDLVIDKGLTLITQDLTIKNYGTITIDTEDTVIIDSLKNIGNLTYTDGTGGGALLISDLLLTGGIVYTAKGENGLMQISNSSISSSIGTGTATSGGNIVRILSSNSGNVSTSVNYSLELYNSRPQHVAFADGDVIGNQLSSVIVIDGGVQSGSKIIGNYIASSVSGTAIDLRDPDKNIRILNNYLVSSGTKVFYSHTNRRWSTTWNHYDRAGNLIAAKSSSGYDYRYDSTFTYGSTANALIKANSVSMTKNLEICHNYFYSYHANPVQVALSGDGKVIFNQNAFKTSRAGLYSDYIIKVSGGFATANYNFSDNSSSSFYRMVGITDQKGNNKNNVVYADAGNPDPFYNDIDGTRCDVSYEGGAYPYSTFTRAGRIVDATLRKPLVMWVEAPRKIRPGQKIEIKATGIAF